MLVKIGKCVIDTDLFASAEEEKYEDEVGPADSWVHVVVTLKDDREIVIDGVNIDQFFDAVKVANEFMYVTLNSIVRSNDCTCADCGNNPDMDCECKSC